MSWLSTNSIVRDSQIHCTHHLVKVLTLTRAQKLPDDYDFEDIETTKLRHGIKVRGESLHLRQTPLPYT